MLNTKRIQGLKPRKSSYYERDNDTSRGSGRLAVKVYPSGTKDFVFRYFVSKAEKFIFLGRFPETTLAMAREKYKHHGSILLAGKDPKEQILLEKRAEQATIAQEAKQGSILDLLEAHAESKRRKGKRNWVKDLNDVKRVLLPYIAPETKAKDITTDDIILVLAAMINRKAVVHSNRIRSALHAAFQYGLTSDNDPMNYASKKFGIKYNPVTAIPKQTDAEKVGDHFLSKEELLLLLNDMEYRHDDLNISWTVRNLVLLCFHTGGQRPYEIWTIRKGDINWQEKTLTISEKFFKSTRKHVVPLTDTALRIIKRQLVNTAHQNSMYLFPSKNNPEKCIANQTLAQAMDRYRKITIIRYFIPRDFRRTFKTLGGHLGLTKQDRDYIQGHALNDVSSKHYDRYDYLKEKRAALEKWEQYLNESASTNVVTIRSRTN
ncbi:site-specific integrase [Vibrio sp. 99-8-1]|uniref:tyrosine-type recombinase/integrase n=1 Tax=Vibrio sp. 99-8-1 TaxID=2607602 RepID=UPI0014935962|nr:site-specific integrase [Vibrio sp. 99-8-1]NOI67792.1 tyrosine-type recombinase/integrase [Vibrio sp. 99-8-1]